MTSLTIDDLSLPHFVNSRQIGMVGNTPLLFDMRSRYGDRGLIIEGRPDLKADEVFKQINLQRLREGTTSDEVYQLAQSVKSRFLGVDELNRAPEVTQNELLSIMNGYILHKGAPVYLGDGFSVGIGTGNLGNGGYVGTFRIDDALADRLHLFLDLDYWKPTDEDMALIDRRGKADPRVKKSESRDISDKIVEAHRMINAKPTPLEMSIAGRYLERALDYCEKFPAAEHSKDNLKEAWPAICTQKNCKLKNTYCARVKSVGQRTVEAAQSLAKGLQYIAGLKNSQAKDDPLGAMLLAVRLMLPYSGVISPAYLREEGNFNNPNLAARNLATDLEQEINAQFSSGRKPGQLTRSLAYAQQGKLDQMPYEAKPEWRFAGRLLERINEENKKP